METNEYLDMFIEESEEHLLTMSDEMLKFEQNPNNIEIVNVMFRAAHTLKGMSGTMGFEKIQKLTHTVENMMDDIRNGQIQATQETIDFMFKGIERLEKLVDEIKNLGAEQSDISDLINEGTNTVASAQVAEEEDDEALLLTLTDIELEAIDAAKESGQNVFEVDFKLIDECLLRSVRANMFFKEVNKFGEIIAIKQTTEEIDSDSYNGKLNLIFITREPKDKIEGLVKKLSEVEYIKAAEWVEKKPELVKEIEEAIATNEAIAAENQRRQTTSIRVNLEKIEDLMGLFEEFIVEKGRLTNIAARLHDGELGESLETINRVSTDMQNSLLSMRMIPLETIFNRFPRMVRNTSKELGKAINFTIEGAETELDRTVVEELGDPLVHLLRNSMDHGVEMPEVRKERGKNPEGSITLKAYHKGNEAIIEIQDDGNGIDVNKIKNKLLDKGIESEETLASMSDDMIIQYIFSSGMSTADKVTNLSGRGVGLDVVKTKIESLGGTVKVETTMGVGTRFVIVLPLTLSIIQGLLVQENDQTFVVPLSNVLETISIEDEQMREVLGRGIIYYRNEVLNIHQFGELFSRSINQGDNDQTYALIIRNAFQKYALLVDNIVGQLEIVLKPLQGYTKDIEGLTGATVLGDGSVAFVLDVNHFQR